MKEKNECCGCLMMVDFGQLTSILRRQLVHFLKNSKKITHK